jgi:hypothetical protein
VVRNECGEIDDSSVLRTGFYANLGGAALALGAHRVVFVPSGPASSSSLL